MDTKTGTIHGPDEIEELQRQATDGQLAAARKLARMIPCTAEEAKALEGMNRAQRRAWASDRRKEGRRFAKAARPAAPKEGT